MDSPRVFASLMVYSHISFEKTEAIRGLLLQYRGVGGQLIKH